MEAPVEGKAEEEFIAQLDTFPTFIVAMTAITAVLWSVTAPIVTNRDTDTKSWEMALGGLERMFPGKTDLKLTVDCVDYRWQAWRWLTYQFSHVGFSHIFCNCTLNLVMGIPLEKLHGPWHSALMYNVGVIGGALCYVVGDARTSVVGMSGGCYSLIGLHLAYTIQNWHQRKYRNVVVVMLVLFMIGDVSINCGLVEGDGATKASNSAHLGGVLAGLIMGIVFGKNLHVKPWEVYLRWAMIALAVMLICFSMSWLLAWPPMNVWDSEPYCWLRKVHNASLFGNSTHGGGWRCARCTHQNCIDQWSQQHWIASVTIGVCEDTLGWATG
jgi:membrane associated rhomboid family serine protease